jgi:NTP pyrophosphatase (non-canonical NTP hydrolase)
MNSIEQEIMDIAQEECAEVIQAISKVKRFGLDSVHKGVTNKDHLETEIGDVWCMIELMIEKGIVEEAAILEAARRKRFKLQEWSNIL